MKKRKNKTTPTINEIRDCRGKKRGGCSYEPYEIMKTKMNEKIKL